MILKDIRVVELAQGVAGPMASLRLGDLGASVVKIEPAEGDWTRGCPPFTGDPPISAVFFGLNRGKQGVALGPSPEAASGVLRRLLQGADVFITDRSPSELERVGLSLEYLRERNPGLISVLISGFGAVGPLADRPGSELVAQAMAGYTRYLGVHGQPARRLGADVAGASTGIFAVQAVLAALFWRGRTGQGQEIHLSLLNSLLSMKTIHISAQADPDQFEGPRVGGANDPPEHGWKTADSPITFSFGFTVGKEGRPGWQQFVEEVGLSRLLEDPRFDRTGRRTTGIGARSRELKPEYEREFVNWPAETLVEIARKHGGSASVFLTHDQMFAHPQTEAAKVLRTVSQPDGGEAQVASFPAHFSRMEPELRGGAPSVGQHTREVVAEVGLSATEVEELLESGGLYVEGC